MVNKILNISQMIIYKKIFGENMKTFVLIKKEKVFIKYLEILEKVRNIIKNKFNSELIHGKKYLKNFNVYMHLQS